MDPNRPFILTVCLVIAGCAATVPPARTSTLEDAIRSLPPKYLGDSPYQQRASLLGQLHSDGDTCRWDPDHEWMNFFSDSGGPTPTSMIYLRLLNREDGEKLVFVHMPKPFAHGSTPDLNQTFILEPAPRGEWIDVTQQLMPKGVDMTAHFSPLRSKPLIEIAPYVKFNRADGKGAAYEFGKCTQELWWNGWSLELRSVPSRILAEDS